jgi:hypothetical protein
MVPSVTVDGMIHIEKEQETTMETKKSTNMSQEEKKERKQQNAKIRKEKRKLILQQNKDNKWKAYLLATVFFILDIFD